MKPNIIWVFQRLTTLPHMNPGWNFATDAEQTTMFTQGCAEVGFKDSRTRTHIKRVPPKVPV